MTQQQKHLEITKAIDHHLGNRNFDAVMLTAENKYHPWYARLLSSIALLASGEEVVYAYSDYGQPLTDVRIVVFSTNLVFVADVDPNADGLPVAFVARRGSLISVKLSASERIDARDRRSHEWPGMLNLVLTYRDIPNPIEIVADGANRYAVHEPSPIVSLIEGLSADLAKNYSHD